MTTATQLPLPHFLNLPLPPIPSDPSLSSARSASTLNQSNHQPLVFKLNLSPDQFEELLNLDAEIEEGEEGGLRLEFDQFGKGKLHLNPTRLLLLNPPRSGPSRTNKPEEIYCHTAASTPSSSRSPLTGLLRIPTSTCVYDLQRFTNSDHATAPTNTSHADPIHSNQPSYQNAQAIKNPGSTSELSQREKLAGQRLKEKRLEEDKRKKEKQMVVLPDGYSAAPPPKRTRQAKSKAVPSKDQFSIKQPPTTAAPNTGPASKSHAQAVASVTQPLPPRRALPGSQTGKHLAHVHNQHLSNPPTPPLKPVGPQPQSDPPPLPQPLPIPAPPAVVFKPPNSSRRVKNVGLNQPSLPEKKLESPAEPPSVTSFSAGTRDASHSDEDDASPAQTQKLPTPPHTSLKHVDPPHRPKSPRANAAKNDTHIQTTYNSLADPAGVPPASVRPNPSISLSKRLASKRTAEVANGMTADCTLQTQHGENASDREVSESPSKKHRAEMATPDPAPPPPRPRKCQKRNEVSETQSNLEATDFVDPPPPSPQPPKTEEQPRKPTITIKKITVSGATARNQSGMASQMENAGTVPIARKRVLEPENSASNVLNKRVRQEEGGSVLPTIRKVVRAPAVNGESSSATHTTNGPIKRVKKKKKLKQLIDYTSSEVEEGEEPGEIVRSSARSRPPPPVVAAPAREATEVPRAQQSNVLSSGPTHHEPPAEERLPSRPNRKAVTQHPPPTDPNPTPPTNTDDKLKNNDELSAYHNSRLLFYKLSTHYEFVCSRLEEFKEKRRKFGSLEEVEQLLFEAYGLEIELDRVKNRIIRNYLTGPQKI